MTRETTKQTEGRCRPARAAAPLMLLVLGVVMLVVALVERDSLSGQEAPSIALTGTVYRAGPAVVQPEEEPILTHPVPNPKRMTIPAIGVDARVVPVGLLKSGDMQIPHSGEVGWYKLGPPPGQPGPVVMVGHLDTARDPAVFYRLKDLLPGDLIHVYGADGDVATFVVDATEQWLKAELPTERIWDYTPEAVIRLITCGGQYDRKSHHYLSNLIVYGHLTR